MPRRERFIELGHFFISPGFCDEQSTCYLAEGLKQGKRAADGIEEENLVVERIALSCSRISSRQATSSTPSPSSGSTWPAFVSRSGLGPAEAKGAICLPRPYSSGTPRSSFLPGRGAGPGARLHLCLQARHRRLRALLSDHGVSLAGVDVGLVESYVAFLGALAGGRPRRRGRWPPSADCTASASTSAGRPGPNRRRLHAPKIPQAIPKALSEEEVELLLSAVVGDDPRAFRDRAILETLYATGMRISELAGLRLGDLDLAKGLAVAYGKGSKERLVPVGRQAIGALGAWLGPGGRPQMAPVRLARRGDAEAVFISTARNASCRAKPCGRSCARQPSRSSCRGQGLAARLAPLVRHTPWSTEPTSASSRSFRAMRTITTTQVYTKVSPELLRRVYEKAHPRALVTRG